MEWGGARTREECVPEHEKATGIKGIKEKRDQIEEDPAKGEKTWPRQGKRGGAVMKNERYRRGRSQNCYINWETTRAGGEKRASIGKGKIYVGGTCNECAICQGGGLGGGGGDKMWSGLLKTFGWARFTQLTSINYERKKRVTELLQCERDIGSLETQKKSTAALKERSRGCGAGCRRK